MKDTESCCPWYLTKTTLLLLSAYQRRDMWRRCTVKWSTHCTEVPSRLFSWAPQQLILVPSVAVVPSIHSFLSIVFDLSFLYYIPRIHTKWIAYLCTCSLLARLFTLLLVVVFVSVSSPESSVQARKHILEIHTRDWNPKMAEPFIDELAEKCVGKSASCTSNCPPSCLNKKFLKNSSWSVVLPLMFFVLHESSKTYN